MGVPMSGNPHLHRTLGGLASLRLAVLTMLSLGAVCAWATFYEMDHGTEAAQRDIFRTWWFAAILVVLGINILSVMVSRYPWKPHHAGFLIAHVGILTLLAGSLVSLHYGLDSNLPLYEGESGDRVLLLDRAVMVALPGQAGHGQFPAVFERHPPRPGAERRFEVPGSGVTLVAEDFHPHVKLREEFAAGSEPFPALKLALASSFVNEELWLAARDEARAHVDLGPASFGFHEAQGEKDADALLTHGAGQNHVSFVLMPDASLRYAIFSRSGPGPRGIVKPGESLQTPWMGMTLRVVRLLEKARLVREVAGAAPPEKDTERQPAVKLRLEGAAGRSPSEWLLFGEARTVSFGAGTATLAYRAPEVQLPFKVTLLKFNSDKYPGSSMAATFESWVRVDDAERGSSEHHISMNHPLHYRGYIFFQASFVEGQPMMSVFSVARAPGLPLVYLGVTLIGLGVAWMFYLKPYLARRQAARALAARRSVEEKHEESPGVPVAAAADPASSGA